MSRYLELHQPGQLEDRLVELLRAAQTEIVLSTPELDEAFAILERAAHRVRRPTLRVYDGTLEVVGPTVRVVTPVSAPEIRHGMRPDIALLSTDVQNETFVADLEHALTAAVRNPHRLHALTRPERSRTATSDRRTA